MTFTTPNGITLIVQNEQSGRYIGVSKTVFGPNNETYIDIRHLFKNPNDDSCLICTKKGVNMLDSEALLLNKHLTKVLKKKKKEEEED